MNNSARVAFLLVLSTISICATVPAQVLDRAVLNSAVWITYEGDPAGKPTSSRNARLKQNVPVFGGTGFLLFQGLGLTKGQVFLVTNKHVLPREGRPQSIKLRVVTHDAAGEAKVGTVVIPVVGSDGKYLPSVRLHPDPETDVAAINVALTAFGERFQVLTDALETGRCLDSSMLVSVGKGGAPKFGLGSSVYLIGFPASLFDSRNVSPILRTGVIATDPTEGFSFNDELRRTMHLPQHVDGFLIDAGVYPGSSGSLVILARGTTDERESGASGPAERPQIVGIVGGSIPIFDASLRSYERIGMGIVYSADTIREVLQPSVQ